MNGRISFDGKQTRPVPVLILSPDAVEAALKLRPPAVEFRADLFQQMNAEEMKKIMTSFRSVGSAVLLTIRRKHDGGLWDDAEERVRRALIVKLMPLADAVDLELDLLAHVRTRDAMKRLIMRARSARVPILLSVHDMKAVPRDEYLDGMLLLAKKSEVSRLKIAGFAQNRTDADRLAQWALANSSTRLPITAVAMGKAGAWTRWELPLKLGGPAYAPLGTAVAPGQISYETLVRKLLP